MPKTTKLKPTIDPRLVRIARLLHDVHPFAHVSSESAEHLSTFRLVLAALLERVDWMLVDPDKVGAAIASFLTPTDRDPDTYEAQSEMLDEVVKVADSEHASICACCRRAEDDPDAEFRRLVVELQQHDPKALRRLLVDARRMAKAKS